MRAGQDKSVSKKIRRNSNVARPIIALKDLKLRLTSRAGPVDILRGLTLDIAPGQSLSILGPSGSGKTSLLMVLAGLERPTSGDIVVAGHDLTSHTEDELALVRGANIGIVFQAFHLVPTMTALENVALPLEFAGNSHAFQIAERFLRDVGLGARVHHFPAELSGGEQQRVAIARAIAPSPKIILADEPTGNLDATTGRQVIDLLLGLKEKLGATLVLVTHDERLAARCERTIRMSDGRIISDERAVAA